MRRANLRLPYLRPYQRKLVADPARDVLTVSSTQVGKSLGEACWLVSRAWRYPSKLHPYWWLAPTYNQVLVGFRYVVALALSSALLATRPVMSPYPTVRLINGAFIEFRSWQVEENLMGSPIAGGVVDEAGLLSPMAQGAISTRRSSTLGPLHYIGNPGLVAGPFRKLCSLAEQAKVPGNRFAGVYSLHKWTWKDKYAALLLENAAEAEGYRLFIEQERASLPDYEFRRLYEAEWTEDEAAVFRGSNHLVVPGEPLLTKADDRFAVGIDVAQTSDWFAAVSMGQRTRRLELRERFRGVGYPDAAQRLRRLQAELGGAAFVLEVNGPGIAIAQEFDRIGVPYVPFTTTNQSKQEVLLSLAAEVQATARAVAKEKLGEVVPDPVAQTVYDPVTNEPLVSDLFAPLPVTDFDGAGKRLWLADHPPMPYEFSTFRYQKLPAGGYRYSAPPGEHDDTVMAGALAHHGVLTAVFDLAASGWL